MIPFEYSCIGFTFAVSLPCDLHLSVLFSVRVPRAQQQSHTQNSFVTYAYKNVLSTAAFPDIPAPRLWWPAKADQAQHHSVHGGPLALDVAMLDSLGATSSPQLPGLASSP